jgi:REP-associated tyrosine transposase
MEKIEEPMYFQKGYYYHLYNRGINRGMIFFNEENYEYLIKILSETSMQYDMSIIAYCLLPNHYHILVRQNSDVTISKWIQYVFNKYVQSVNKQQQRQGSLFQGRVKRKSITSEKYLSEILFYIHLNPLKAKLVDDLEDWKYSNYHECVGKRTSLLWDEEFINKRYINVQNYKHELCEVIQDKSIFSEIEDYIFE